MTRPFIYALCLTWLAAGLCGCKSQPNTQLASGGKAYLAQCAACHGAEGRGDGPLASDIANYSKHPPTVLDAALIKSLGRDGVKRAIETGSHLREGSPMPVWGPDLGPEWTDRIADYVVAAPSAGEAGAAAVASYLTAPSGTSSPGRRIYILYCSGCHGPRGGGDGFISREIASRLKPSRLRGDSLAGLDEAALARLIGPDGSHAPSAATMPGWLHTLSPNDRSALLAYMHVLPGTTEPK